jgi:uncharacterized membrane protein
MGVLLPQRPNALDRLFVAILLLFSFLYSRHTPPHIYPRALYVLRTARSQSNHEEDRGARKKTNIRTVVAKTGLTLYDHCSELDLEINLNFR